MVVVCVDSITPRIEYTFEFIFGQRAISYQLVEKNATVESTISLWYTSDLIDGIQIVPASLLSDSGVRAYNIDKGEFEGEECLIIDGVVDPIAAIFYVLTRYEEYNGVERDHHGRFPFTSTTIHEFGWNMKAMCDRWATQVLKLIGRSIAKQTIKLVPTFDIDNTYAYQYKDGLRKIKSIGRDILQGNKQRIRERKEVKLGGKDPYDTFDIIQSIGDAYPETKVFWLVGDLAKYDRNISTRKPEHQQLIKRVAEHCSIGLHPSYASNGESSKLVNEKQRIEAIVKAEVRQSRQHFLKMKIPHTYRALISVGITDDYTMGFPEAVGFKCGTARSHYWFDVEQNEVTTLVVHPFVYMDGTFNEYMEITPENAKQLIALLYQEVQECGGDFIFIWHNETIGEYGKWKDWGQVLDYTLKLGDE